MGYGSGPYGGGVEVETALTHGHRLKRGHSTEYSICTPCAVCF